MDWRLLSTTASTGLKGEIILSIEIIIIITPVSIIGRQIMPMITTKIETKKQTILDIRNLIEETGESHINFWIILEHLLIHFAQ